jgi:STE24 endopeptidase
LAVSLATVILLALPRVRRAWTGRLRGPWWVRAALATVVVMIAVRLVTLPFSAAMLWQRRQAGLSHQDWGAWAADLAKQELLDTGIAVVAVVALVGLARRLPRAWPAVAALAAAGLVVVGSLVYPVVVEPVFNTFTPLGASAGSVGAREDEGTLRRQVLDLAEREGVRVDEILVADASRRTTSLNAYVSGFGATRRVVLYDNLVESMDDREAMAVVAHELAHAKYDDVLVGTLLGAAGAAAVVGVLGLVLGGRGSRQSVAAVTTVPVLLAAWMVGTQLVSPLVSGVSRQMEMRADVTAVRATQDPEAFIEMQRILAVRSLADPTPVRWSQFWWGTHPTFAQRVTIAERVGEQGE